MLRAVLKNLHKGTECLIDIQKTVALLYIFRDFYSVKNVSNVLFRKEIANTTSNSICLIKNHSFRFTFAYLHADFINKFLAQP